MREVVEDATRYYLSADAVKSGDEVLLIGSLAVPSLPPLAAEVGNTTVTVPTGTPLGAYRILAGAYDTKKVVENDETNNCVASFGSMQVTR